MYAFKSAFCRQNNVQEKKNVAQGKAHNVLPVVG